ncbi:MAG: exosome complex protein Rrp42 [Nanoarchaeota archaeon]
MSDIVRKHTLKLLEQNTRSDLRKLDEYRTITLEYGAVSGAEGSARVRIGDTDVLAGVKFEVGKPFSDTPDQGSIMVNAELRPMSSPDFEPGPPSIKAIEMARVIDRALREGGAIDFKKLCIKEGESMWMVIVDIYPINDAGNLFDAASLAALAAIKDAKFPKINSENKIDYHESTNKKIDMGTMPLSCTIYNIGGKILVDPTNDEEELCDARITAGVLENGSISSLQKGGDYGLTIDQVNEMVDVAIKKSKDLRKVMQK